jgi:glycine betaine/choline ABC-type transport system substrate-binding protein
MLGFCASECCGAERVIVDSKNINEGYLQSEVVAELLARAGYDVERRLVLVGP